MGEVYEFVQDESDEPVLTFGSYSNGVYDKHFDSYGEAGAKKTRSASEFVLRDALKQISDPNMPNNVLLVGKVQSGKTSNLEAIVALACDNGFDLIVMYGGYDNTLLRQTVKRFRKTFDCPVDEDDLGDPEDMKTPVVFTTDEKDDLNMSNIDADVLRDYIEANVPVLVITIKSATRIRQINNIFKELDCTQLNSMIIDDEGDQASLNNVKNKADDASATYASICDMKGTLKDPLYFSVTATPHANIFLNELSALRPGSIHLLHPAAGYCGADRYHVNDSDVIYAVHDEMDEALAENKSPDSLKFAICHFVIACALLSRRKQISKRNRAQMVVHTYREVATHKVIYSWITQYVSDLKYSLDDARDGDDFAARTYFSDAYEKCFDEDIKANNPLCKDLYEDMYQVLKHCAVAMQNGQDGGTRGAAKHKRYQIFVGAQLLERGITFGHLLTTYFTRWAKTGGNMDTNLQRARWFGYRESYMDLCRLFTTEKIAEEFTYLADMEDDLWEQFGEVEAGEKPIRDIVVLAEETKQKPTRRTVADYLIVSADDWLKQSYGTFDGQEIADNNEHIDHFLMKYDFSDESYGRLDGEPNCTEAVVSGKAVADLFENLRGVFDDRGFQLVEAVHLLKQYEKVALIKMSCGKDRVRSFYSDELKGKIKALQQGRDPNSNSYLGDKAVVDVSLPVTVQLYRIVPKIDDKEQRECSQYMFAIYQTNRNKKGYLGI